MTAITRVASRHGLNVYTTIVMVAGGISLALVARLAITADAFAHPFWFIGLLALAIATSFFKLNLQLSGGGSTMTLGYVVGFMGLVILGAHPTRVGEPEQVELVITRPLVGGGNGGCERRAEIHGRLHSLA